MDKYYKRIWPLLLYIFVFIATLRPPYYLDLGWHLRYGEYFFRTGSILFDNPYSSLMREYQWVNGSWGVDLITYFLYNSWGFAGLSVAGSITIILSLFFFSRALNMNFFQKAVIFPLIIYLESPVNYFSFRGHQLSFLFISVLYYLSVNFSGRQTKRLFFIPLLFLLWSNMHRSSFLGLVIFLLMIIFWLLKSYKGVKKNKLLKEARFLFGIFTFSCLATLINPFGVNVHLEALKHVNYSLLKEITEYLRLQPLSLAWFNHSIVFGMTIIVIAFALGKKKLFSLLPIVGMPFVLLAIGFETRRYAWDAYYTCIPLFILVLKFLEQKLSNWTSKIAILVSLVSIIVAIFVLPFQSLQNMSWDNFCIVQNYPCSSKAALFLSTRVAPPKLFTFYDWGGWLIWNYPSVKPSVDGRMAVWRDENGYSAFEEYNQYLNGARKINDSEFDAVFMPLVKSPLYFEIDQLLKDGSWRIIYEDEISVVVVRSPN